jgi:tetratricopeptide (TPR) repeat protein
MDLNLIIAIIGVIVAILTLHYTRKQALKAKDRTRQATAQLENKSKERSQSNLNKLDEAIKAYDKAIKIPSILKKISSVFSRIISDPEIRIKKRVYPIFTFILLMLYYFLQLAFPALNLYDFALTCNNSVINISQGDVAYASIDIHQKYIYNDEVYLSVGSVPKGIKFFFAPKSLNRSNSVSKVTVSTERDTDVNEYSITIIGQGSDGKRHEYDIALSINSRLPTPDSGSTKTFQDSGSTKNSSDSGSTKNSSDSGSTKNSSDSGSTKNSSDSGSTKNSSNLGSTKTSSNLGSTKTFQDSGSTKNSSDSGSTETFQDSEPAIKMYNTLQEPLHYLS